jgi:endonuclease/exonuclease/phosphatase family metal-dependent hydrolase
MRTTTIITLFLIFLLSCRAEVNPESIIHSTSDTLRIATFNVRIRTSSDKGAISWANRKTQVAQIINSYKMDVLGVQELIDKSQEQELSRLLPSFASVSYGRDNQSGSTGERLAIYYNQNRFTLKRDGFFFLSETPEQVSKGWDAALNRICQWALLHDKITKRDFYFFNTHFDHVGKQARAGSAALIAAKIAELTAGQAVICVGDFNASPGETAVYQTITSTLADSRSKAKSVEGTPGTFNGWNLTSATFNENVRIDYVFTGSGIGVEVYQVINDQYSNDTFPSDHFPVFCRIYFE